MTRRYVNHHDIDKTLAEIDLLAIADAVGVYRSGPVELTSDDPAVPDTPTQRAYRQRLAARRARHVEHNRKYAAAFDQRAGHPSPAAPDRREQGNHLARLGFDLTYIARRLGLAPRSHQ